MIGLLQRVTTASVSVVVASNLPAATVIPLQENIANRVVATSNVIARIEAGLLVLIGVERDDTEQQADRLLERLLTYRVFSDRDGKMNVSLTETGGGLLLVPQFTLPADTRKGTRPSFTPAASPAQGEALFNYLCQQAKQRHPIVATGQFGAYMQVSLINDGPVTFWLQARPSN